jgi:CRISPR-associated protein Cmr6
MSSFGQKNGSKKLNWFPAQKAQDVQTPTYQMKPYQISWRFVTNGGQDDGMIRPVIGAYGIPFYRAAV